jgi:hypothetical protein
MQFGGKYDSKFKYKAFRQMLIDNSHKSMKHQQKILADRLNKRMGNGTRWMISRCRGLGFEDPVLRLAGYFQMFRFSRWILSLKNMLAMVSK